MRGESELVERIGTWSLFDLNPAGRVSAFASVAFFASMWSVVWTAYFLRNPSNAPFLGLSNYPFLLQALLVAPPLFAGFALAGLLLRNYPRAHGPLCFGFLQSYFGLFGLYVYVSGPFTTDWFAAGGLTGAIVGMLFFERRHVLSGIVLFLLIVGGTTLLQLEGFLPYAPWYSTSPFENGQINLYYVASYGGIGFLMVLVAHGWTYLFITQWHRRGELNRELMTELATAREQRVSWLEHLASFLRHELNTQLTAVDSSLRLMELSPDKQRNYVSRAETSLHFMRDMVESAARATDIESAITAGQLDRVDLSEAVSEYLRGREAQSGASEIRAEIEEGLVVRGNLSALIQALDKLVSNALDHSTTSTSVRVLLETDGKEARLAVENEGSPLPRHQDQLFAPFVSLRKEEQRSLGIGLFVARRIVELHRGRLTAMNLPGKQGARFEIVLPLLYRQVPAPAQLSPSSHR